VYSTDAWVVHEGSGTDKKEAAAFRLEPFELPELDPTEVLIEPLYGAWEGNYGHAIARDPVDICRERGEKRIVLGNCGVVRVLKPGQSGQGLKEGDICLLLGNAKADEYGYMIKAHAYDARRTVGIMAKKSKAQRNQLVPIPPDNPYSLAQWAAFSLRYVTAWANWKVAFGCWQLQIPEKYRKQHLSVWGWGGGVAFAELSLAKLFGARCVMITSKASRLALAEKQGLETVDRGKFQELTFDPGRYDNDPVYHKAYRRTEVAFLTEVRKRTDARGVAIFIDNIGEPVFRLTLKALAREGVIATSGWKLGMQSSYMRASECIARHTFVHTHYASNEEAAQAVEFALARNWFPPQESLSAVHAWEDIGRLAAEYARNETDSYFPIFQVNRE
jgi:NADPH:quinone reductase-like Zn-dependent oxidoreductase